MTNENNTLFDEESLKADLQKSFAEAEAKVSSVIPEVVREEKKPEEPAPVDEAEEAGEGVQEGEDSVEEPKERAPQDENFPLVPNEWTAEEKEKFEDLLENPETKEAAKVLIDRYDNLKKGFYKKADELAQTKKNLSEFDEIFDPYKDALKQRGYTPARYVSRLLDVDRQLSHNPAAVIKNLMEAYKVTPDKLGISNGADDYYEDDKVAQLERKILELEARSTKQTEDAGRTERESYAQMVRDFRFAVNESGEPKYPLYEEVKEEMAILLQSGKASTLEEAYKLSPTVKEKSFERQQEMKKQKELDEARLRARQAKKSSKAAKPSAGSAAAANDSVDLKDMLAQAFREKGFV